MSLKLLKTAIINTIPVMMGYIVLGIGFGILFEKSGYGILWTLAMSIFVFAGSMQYVAVGLITGGASLISTALTTLMVNARHLFYGISMINRYKGAGLKKLYLMFALTDETYSLVCNGDYPEGEDPHWYCFLVSLCNQCYWVAGSALGAILGAAITFNTAGIEFSMTALFVTIFVEQWLTSKEHRPALIGISASVLCLLIFGSESFLIPAMILITVLLTACRKALEKSAAAAAEEHTDEVASALETHAEGGDGNE